MTRHRAILAVLLALAMTVPAASAFHLSAGAEDVVGLEKSEDPDDPNTPESVYDRGTRTDCEDGDPDDPSTPRQDAMCGLLVYNDEFPGLRDVSPQDQVSRANVEIDLQMATYVGAYDSTVCVIYCQDEDTYDGIHDVGSEFGLTPESDKVDDEGEQRVGGNVYAVSPMQAYAATGHRWLMPVTDTSFVAFVTDEDGDPIDDGQLQGIVEAAKDDRKLTDEARTAVCAFSPQAHLGTHAKSAGRCEIQLKWIGSSDDPACESPAYLCGNVQQAWRGTTVCPMWHAACYLSDTWNSAHHFATWHGVVAPSPQDPCPGAEPGFDVRPGTFLAHDLDVYEPVTDETPAKGVPYYWDEAAQTIPGLGPLREGRTPAVFETPVGSTVAEPLPFTNHTTEANADPWLGIEESSQTVTEARDLTICHEYATGEEEADPWVNVVDAHVTRSVDGLGTPAGSQPEPDHDPRPTMEVSGKVGLFTDVDDDGGYEQAAPTGVFEEVTRKGAYPIIWDYHEPGEGCEQTREGTTIGTVADEAGYTDPTGLVVMLRLNLATFEHERTGETVLTEDPSTVVMLSENLDRGDPVVDRIVDKVAGDREVVVLDEAAFTDQCEQATGGFESNWQIQVDIGEGDGLVAAAVTTLDEPGPGGGIVPDSPITLSDRTTHVWWDVDPFER